MTETTLRHEPTAKRIRAFSSGRQVVDTRSGLLVWENPHFPAYYLPVDDVAPYALVPTSASHDGPFGNATVVDLLVDGTTVSAAGYLYGDDAPAPIRRTVRFRWSKLDAWFEEDEEVFVHPRSPYTRIDILPSSAEVRVEVDGVTVAHTTRARFLFETGLPVRYYIPPTDISREFFQPSDTESWCPYKGKASYVTATVDDGVHDDIAWYYPFPLEESARIAGYYSFYPGRAIIFVDGQPTDD